MRHFLKALTLCCLGLLTFESGAQEPIAPGEELSLSEEFALRVQSGRQIELLVRVTQPGRFADLAARFCGSAAEGPALSQYNAPLSENSFGEGEIHVAVPLSCLIDDYRRFVLLELFPEDKRDGADWIHIARQGRLPTFDEGLWQVAEWFTGDGSRFTKLSELNQLASPELRAGQAIRIPAALLHTSLKARMASDDGTLEFGTDDRGPFASYRLKPGEALYSSVIMRFTGRTTSESVTEAATQIAQRSHIVDLRDIPAGFDIKIPLDFLEPQFLPETHPRRIALEKEREALAEELARTPIESASGLQNVVVIIDPGHGGKDLGTFQHGIRERDFVYDVACRMKQRLEKETLSKVYLTISGGTPCQPTTQDDVPADVGMAVQTSPKFFSTQNGDAKISANLRWYLANSLYRRLIKQGVSPDKIVFISLHADSRHPSAGGLMVYVPGAAYRTKNYGHGSSTYKRFAEVREKTYVRFSKKQRVRSEAVSKKFADRVVRQFQRYGLPVHKYQPIRNRIVRSRTQRFVPAVLRSNTIPTKVLVEFLNLRNQDDAKRMGKADERQKMANAVVDALFAQYGESPAVDRAP